jgi:hypothetical protein
MLTYFPEIYPDELLYSVLGRLGCHSGILRREQLLNVSFGSRNISVRTFLQSNLGQLVASIPPAPELTGQRLAMETTLLPYFTAYQSQEVRDWALAKVIGESSRTNSVHARLGVSCGNVRLPSALRYCPTCRDVMLKERGELYWRRDHQLPGVLVCPTHGTPLADSRVVLSKTREREIIAADEDNCPASPAPPAWADQPEAVKRLQDIAIASATLLTTPPLARSIAEWGEETHAALRSRGLGLGSTLIDQPALLDAFLIRFDPVMNVLAEAVPFRWLNRIARRHSHVFTPLYRILISLLVESMPLVESGNPFGPGPWPCRNPLSEHYGQAVITNCKLYKRYDGKGKTMGTFRCSCGYVFSTSPGREDRAKILDFGLVFKARLCELTAAGTNQKCTATALHVDRRTVLHHASMLGLEVPWKARAVQNKLPPIEREAMRSAWNDAHAAAPDLTRTQLGKKMSNVHRWLCRNDRDWLDTQPPVAKPVPPAKPRLDWPAIDAVTVQTMKQEATRLRAQDPPQRVSRPALELAIGRRGWFKNRLHGLPLCVIALTELTESDTEFRCRRIVWAAEKLRIKEQPINVSGLRRAAMLPTCCPPEVESFLTETVSNK